MTKRHFDAAVGSDDDDLGVLVQNSKGRPSFRNVVGDVLRGIAANDFMFRLEPLIRTVVREEVESSLRAFNHSSTRPMLNQIEPAAERAALQLRFVNKLPSTIFTGSRLEAEEGGGRGAIKVVLIDPNTNSLVTSGPLSSIKIEIVALDGEFGADDQDNWSEKEFSSNIVREREGKRPLVTGETVIILRGGVGILGGELAITDNSSWLRSRKFRLGARIVQKFSSELRIREARSEAFVVKDHRGELYKKHYPPRLTDEVWRLERIAKEGVFHQRLAWYNIQSVKDFLQNYETNPNSLREMLRGISNRTWEQIVLHASQCITDDNKLYSHHIAVHGVGLLFNSVYKLVGATFDGQNYQPFDKLTMSQKMVVEKLKRQAYENLNDWVEIDEAVLFGPSRPLIEQPQEFSALNLHHDFSITNQEENGRVETPTTNNDHALHLLPPISKSSFRMSEFFSCIPIDGENAIVPADDSHELFMPSWSPNWGHETNFCFGSSSEPILTSFPSFGLHRTRTRKSRVGWCKIKAAIKLRLVKRELAARRKYQGLCL
jgi:hypothetical protein